MADICKLSNRALWLLLWGIVSFRKTALILAQGVTLNQTTIGAQSSSNCNIALGGWNPCPVPVGQISSATVVEELRMVPKDEVIAVEEDAEVQKSVECVNQLNAFDELCDIQKLQQSLTIQLQSNCCESAVQLNQVQCVRACEDPIPSLHLQTWDIICGLGLYSSCSVGSMEISTDVDIERERSMVNTAVSPTVEQKRNKTVNNLVQNFNSQGQVVAGNISTINSTILEDQVVSQVGATTTVQQISQIATNLLGDINTTATPVQAQQTIVSPPQVLVPQPDACIIQNNANAAGALLETTTAEDVGECCAKCQQIPSCNAFAYCPKLEGCRSILGYPGEKYDHKLCDLKTQISIINGANPVYWYRGVDTDWTSGFIFKESEQNFTAVNGCVDYFTRGPSQLAVQEGSKVLGPNGDNFLNVNDAKDCVTACEALNKQCKQVCCDSAAYNPDSKQCWLKYGASSEETELNEYGWQTFFRSVDDSDNQLAVGSFELCWEDMKGGIYTDAYVTYGVGQLAVSEGSFIAMADGTFSKRGMSLQKCAQECQKLPACDALTYTAEEASCYLRSGSRKFDTISMQKGQTTYWRVQRSISQPMCSQQSGWYCLFCGGDYNETCEYY